MPSYADLSILVTQSHIVCLLIWVRCTFNRSHSTPCEKADFEPLQFFKGHCLDIILPVSNKICDSPIKIEKTTYLENLVFSAFSVL